MNIFTFDDMANICKLLLVELHEQRAAAKDLESELIAVKEERKKILDRLAGENSVHANDSLALQ